MPVQDPTSAYATPDDMVLRFGRSEMTGLTDPSRNAVIDETVLLRALADAKGIIDAAITDHLPVGGFAAGDVPPLLTRLNADIARYLLHDDRAPKTVRQRYEDALDLLARINKGQMALAGADGTEADASAAEDGAGAPQAEAPTRLFTLESMKEV